MAKTVSAFLVADEAHIPFLRLQFQNLNTFDKIYVIFNGVSLDTEIPFKMSDYLNVSFIISRDKISLEAAHRILLDRCTTDYFMMLSPNNFTHGQILNEVRPLLENEYKLIYSDNGYIENEGKENQKVTYYYKPGFDKELLYGQNYLNGATFYSTQTAKDLNAFNGQLETAVDWSLSLLITHHISPEEIFHIPIPLIAIKNDNLSNNSVDYRGKGNEIEDFKNLIQYYIKSTNRDVNSIDLTTSGYFDVVFKAVDSHLVTIIILTKDKLELLKPCVTSILNSTKYTNYNIVIVDNESTDPETLLYLNEMNAKEKVTVYKYPFPFDFAKIHNVVVKKIVDEFDPTFICLLNNDTEVIDQRWLSDMVGIASDPSVGAVGAKLLFEDNTIQHAGVVLGIGGLANHYYSRQPMGSSGYWDGLKLTRNYSGVTGACLLVRTSHYRALNGMWDKLPIAYNDVDLCIRLRDMGLRNCWTPHALLYHYESKSRGSELDKEDPSKLLRFARDHIYMRYKHGTKIYNDPYYNENLDFQYTDYRVGPSHPNRRKFKQKQYRLDFPYGLEFVNPTWIPMPTSSAFTCAVKVPKVPNSKLVGIVLPFHRHDAENTNGASKFHLSLKFPGDEKIYHYEQVTNTQEVIFRVDERDLSDVEHFTLELTLLSSTGHVHLRWFYSENEMSMAFSSVKGRQFKLSMLLEDLG